jgi:drug/metabolite transporter (DMT)-like permease
VVLFAQSIFAAGYLVAQKQVLERVPPITTTAAMYAVGTPLMTATALIFLPLNSATWTTNTTGIWAIVYAVAAQSVAAYILNAYANKNSKSSTVAVFETVNVRSPLDIDANQTPLEPCHSLFLS